MGSKLMKRKLFFAICIFVTILSIVSLPSVYADTFKLGGVELEYSPLNHFIEASDIFPVAASYARSTLPSSIRMIGFYVDTTKLADSLKPTDPIPYFLVLATSSYDAPFSEEDLEYYKSTLGQHSFSFKPELLEEFRRAQKEFFDIDNAQESQPIVLESKYDRNSITNLMLVKQSGEVYGEKQSHIIAMSSSILRIKNRLIMIYLVKTMGDDRDVFHVRTSMLKVLSEIQDLNKF